jgi:tryptophan-rich sensory protein
MIKHNSVRLFLSLAVAFAAGAIGSIVTFPSITTWYAGLDKPFFSPPNWVFGPVWTLLYALMGISLYLVWTAKIKGKKQTKRGAYIAFGAQLLLNSLWSAVFFGLHQPWAGVGVIAALWFTIVATMWLFWPISRRAVYLLVPYLLWVGFAGALNIAVAMLNPTPPITSYDDCTRAQGSIILTSYPAICRTSSGRSFTDPNAKPVVPPTRITE